VKFVRSIQVLAACAVLVAGCAPPFSAPNLVDRPRVIAVTTSPIAVMAGEQLTARAILGGAQSFSVRKWRVCVPARIDPFPEQRCADGEGAVAYSQEGGERLEWSLPTEQSQLATILLAAFVDANGNIPNVTTALNQLRANGADLLVYVEAVSDTGMVVRGVKRALFVLNGLRYTPLSAFAFTFAGTRFQASGDDCVPDGAMAPVTVAPRSTHRVALEPLGGLEMNQPDAAHFADGGDFPVRYEVAGITDWVAPTASGVTTKHWVLIQRNVPRASGSAVADLRVCSFSTVTR
jgi:hypothetical protein